MLLHLRVLPASRCTDVAFLLRSHQRELQRMKFILEWILQEPTKVAHPYQPLSEDGRPCRASHTCQLAVGTRLHGGKTQSTTARLTCSSVVKSPQLTLTSKTSFNPHCYCKQRRPCCLCFNNVADV